ncbi:MAG TPA: galactose oxidase-like domain-containing protein [Verrucomicrobiae bacterium]|nr:galactose oxidase-like domain-containing protein [Verrucomicrobiae bacterium]
MIIRKWLLGGRRVPSLLWMAAGLLAPATGQVATQGQWTTLPFLMPINPVHMALMHNGQVLIVSGSGNLPSNTNFAAAVWNPQTGNLTTQPVAWDMFCNGMAILPDGRPLVVGGTLQYDPFFGQLATSAYDPATGIFTNQQSMAHGRWYPTVISLSDGSLMTFSGLDENGNTNTTVEIFKAAIGWSSPVTAPWTPPLYPRLHLLPNGKVFYSGSTTSSSIFDPATQTWTLNVAQTNFGNTRTYGSSVLLPLTLASGYKPVVMIMGGSNPATATTELIDLSAATPRWAKGPAMSQARVEMNATILPNGKVVALGGSVNDEDGSTASFNTDIYDPHSNTFSTGAPNAFPRLYHSNAMLLPDATVLVTGSNPARGTYEQHSEIYSPGYLFNANGSAATRPSITSATPAAFTYGGAFQVQTPDAASITKVALMRAGAVTHSFDMEQRLVELSFTAGNGVLNVTAPPNGNIAPPGYYLVFILNSAGVPSVGSFVQITASTPPPPPPPPPPSSIAEMQVVSTGTNSSASQSVSLTETAGNLLVAAVYWNGSNAITISDSLGNTWNSAPVQDNSAAATDVQIWYAQNIKGGANTVTLTQPWAVTAGFYVIEYSGLATTNVLDTSAGRIAPTSTQVADTGNLTTSGSRDLVVGLFADTWGSGTMTPASGWISRGTDPNFYSLVVDNLPGGTGTFDPTASLPGSNSDAAWSATAVAFKAK